MLRGVLLAFLVVSWLAAPADADQALQFVGGRQSATSEGQVPTALPVRRTILAIYDGREQNPPVKHRLAGAPASRADRTRIHRLAEMPLNFLGYRLEYWDLDSGLPDLGKRNDIAAVVAWFERPMDEAPSFLKWALALAETPVRLILIAPLGEESGWPTRVMLAAILEHLGLSYEGDLVTTTYRSRKVKSDPAVYEFERPLRPPFPPFADITAKSPSVETHLEMSMPFAPGQVSAVVATGPHGGFADSRYVYYYDDASNRMKWLLNPFTFFRKALGQPAFPVPDVTTLSGRRIYFSHIDGDGWNNITRVERYHANETISAGVVADALIETHPDLPVSVGLIAGDIDPDLGGTRRAAKVAKELFALPQVEVASHTFTHPFDWSFYEHYDRAVEEALLNRIFVDDRPQLQRYVDKLTTLGHRKPVDRRYIAGSSDAPRAYSKEPFDLHHEIVEALAVSQSLAPPGKTAALYQWSGDTNPFEAAIRAERQTGVAAMNGGDSRFDDEWPSAGYVPPIARPVGHERQIYAVNSNENTYTNDWTGPYFGYGQLPETLRHTETPRRLKGIDVYFHMYTGERPAALRAAKNLLDEMQSAPVAPIRASQYVAVANGFFTARLVQAGPRSWRIENRGALQTVRFDQPDARIDLAASVGVIGYMTANGSLYVSLDPSVATPTVALLADVQPRSRLPYLVESRWQFSNFTRNACGFSAHVTGFGDGDAVFAGMAPANYDLTLVNNGAEVWRDSAEADGTGRLEATMHADARTSVLELRVACR